MAPRVGSKMRKYSDEEDLFLVILYSSTSKSWKQMTDCFNEEFDATISYVTLRKHWSNMAGCNAIFMYLRNRGYVSRQLEPVFKHVIHKFAGGSKVSFPKFADYDDKGCAVPTMDFTPSFYSSFTSVNSLDPTLTMASPSVASSTSPVARRYLPAPRTTMRTERNDPKESGSTPQSQQLLTNDQVRWLVIMRGWYYAGQRTWHETARLFNLEFQTSFKTATIQRAFKLTRMLDPLYKHLEEGSGKTQTAEFALEIQRFAAAHNWAPRLTFTMGDAAHVSVKYIKKDSPEQFAAPQIEQAGMGPLYARLPATLPPSSTLGKRDYTAAFHPMQVIEGNSLY